MRRETARPDDSFYVRVAGRLWADRRNLIFFGLGAAAHALAQGTIAGCAGLLAKALLTYDDAHQLAAVDPPSFWGADSGLASALTDPVWVCLLGFAAACVKAIAGAATCYAQNAAAFRIGDQHRQAAISAVLSHGRGGASPALAHAAIALRIREVEAGVSHGVLAVTKAAAQLGPLSVALAVVSTPLAGLSVLVLAPFGVLLSRTRARLRERQATSARRAEELAAGVDELVRHVDLWRTYGAGDRVRREIARLGEVASRSAATAEAARAAVSGANEALGALVLLAVVGLSATVVADPGTVVAFCAAFFMLYRPVRDLADGTLRAQRGADAARELDQLFAQPPRARELPSSFGRTNPQSSRRTWPLAPLVLEGVQVRPRGMTSKTPATSLRAEPGEVVAIVGPTGCGKTSLLRGLLGLEHEIDGAVRYGGLDLGRAGVGPGERPFAWVPQEAPVVRGTLEDNVALGVPDSSCDERARSALDAVGAGELARTRQGDVLQPGGADLSGGERQWVALARALASGLPVLLLDEPTAGLDRQSQDRVLDALRAIRGERTVLLVTHRLEPLSIADRVIEMGAPSRASEPRIRAGAA